MCPINVCVGRGPWCGLHPLRPELNWGPALPPPPPPPECDRVRGAVLKAVVDVHASAVVSVRCFVQGGSGGGGGVGGIGGIGAGGSSDPAAITADVEGVVNKLCFRRVMWTKWIVDTECLLDGGLRDGDEYLVLLLSVWAAVVCFVVVESRLLLVSAVVAVRVCFFFVSRGCCF